MIEKRILKRISAEAKPGRRKYLRLETQGNVVQCSALSHLRLGTLLSYLIKNFSGAEAKPERRKIPEVRNLALNPIAPDVRYPFFFPS